MPRGPQPYRPRPWQRKAQPPMLPICLTCTPLIQTLIRELMVYANKEYVRGMREAANVLHAHADRREQS